MRGVLPSLQQRLQLTDCIVEKYQAAFGAASPDKRRAMLSSLLRAYCEELSLRGLEEWDGLLSAGG